MLKQIVINLKSLKMETKKVTSTKKIQLVKGEFTSPEANDIIMSLIDEKINFHKLQRLQLWEGNHICKTDLLDGRIKELLKEKLNTKEFLVDTKEIGRKYVINGILEIKVSE